MSRMLLMQASSKKFDSIRSAIYLRSRRYGHHVLCYCVSCLLLYTVCDGVYLMWCHSRRRVIVWGVYTTMSSVCCCGNVFNVCVGAMWQWMDTNMSSHQSSSSTVLLDMTMLLWCYDAVVIYRCSLLNLRADKELEELAELSLGTAGKCSLSFMKSNEWQPLHCQSWCVFL